MTITVVPNQALIDTLDELAAAYGLASRLLLAPADDALLGRLVSPGLLDAWPACHCEESVRGLASMRRSEHDGETVEALAVDFVRLFVGPPSLIPPPYESAYRPTEELEAAPSTVDVRDEGHVFGLEPRTAARREGDHLGLELAFAGRLCLAAREAAAAGGEPTASLALSTHHAFLEEHLLRWAPGCLREIEGAATTHVYRGAAELALSVLTCAHERLG
jgi:TorA maturation chaperone TorD